MTTGVNITPFSSLPVDGVLLLMHYGWVVIGDIHIDDINDIVWKERMLDDLVLDPIMKTIIKGLVGHHSSVNSQSLRDVIPGKGMGLIMLFSGPPGIGKTLTAVVNPYFSSLYRS